MWHLCYSSATYYDIWIPVTSGSAPVTAVLIILSIGIAGGTLQATGGIDYLVYIASRVIERFPKSIIFIAPMIVFVFVLELVLQI